MVFTRNVMLVGAIAGRNDGRAGGSGGAGGASGASGAGGVGGASGAGGAAVVLDIMQPSRAAAGAGRRSSLHRTAVRPTCYVPLEHRALFALAETSFGSERQRADMCL